MFTIVQKSKLAENTHCIEIEAPEIAKKAKPGQFVMIMLDEKGEKIPLTMADIGKKTITLIILEVGKTTKEISKLKKGSSIYSITGPLGNPSEIRPCARICIVAGGLGIATIYPIAKSYKEHKCDVTIIIGARNRQFLFWEERLKKISKKLIICTDDGSRGKKGLVTDALKEVMDNERPDRVIAIGPPLMMKAVSELTRNRVRTVVSLNPIMVDGTGMCGGCRVSINGKIKFACIDGPEFDGHSVDFDMLINRNTTYSEEECNCRK